MPFRWRISPGIKFILPSKRRCSSILLRQNAGAQNKSPRRFIQKTPPIEPDPDECCGSGCSNCVWLMYTDDLIEHFGKEGLEEAVKVIKAEVTDPMIQQFLLMELRLKKVK
ncbi:unnamed protein product [Oikopleura dioica]|uniref:Oxidoreductase-like domain-containing protein n=1 Tax=Oikopleura dioica TaxID=34765 RepID=E4X3X8_OIKDI|nr:unnamed protein product [Oikopleura dioica]